MSVSRPLEEEYLADAEKALKEAVSKHDSPSFELRLQVLEAVSTSFSGIDLAAYHEAFGISSILKPSELLDLAGSVVNAINSSVIKPSFALSILARETLQEQERKSSGAYHTDFRLAARLAQRAAQDLTYKSVVIDPACGAGILLTALTDAVCGTDKSKASYWLANGVCAADLSVNALRASVLCLASFTDDLDSLIQMRRRWYLGDSLMADPEVWTALAPEGFDAVIGNPPWEKIKLSRHEFLKFSGSQRHYGDHIGKFDEESFFAQRNNIANYSRKLAVRYPDLTCGEPDLYIAFTSLFLELCKNKGVVAALFPGGLIRSRGTEVVRKKIINSTQSLSVSIIDNRARFFAIDSRFKFVAVSLIKAETACARKTEAIQLLHERGTAEGLENIGSASIDRSELAAIRADFSIPEVRSDTEWKLFLKIFTAGISWSQPGSGWFPKFCREVDMTKERRKFLNYKPPQALPLIEGRMVHSHRFGVKGYVAGTGRRALWEANLIGDSTLSPQYHIHLADVPVSNQQRIQASRVGFCDIAGQTNERSLTAAFIPSGVVCGNKVPTILFPEDPTEDRLFVWLGIANSFAFDWMLRRVLTTTVNYFLLQSLPLPCIAKGSEQWYKLADHSHELWMLDKAGSSLDTYHQMAEIRAEIDAEVALAYGLSMNDMELIFKDFPIVDKGQPALLGESKSTITRDIVLAKLAEKTGQPSRHWLDRVDLALSSEALAYVPSQLALMNKTHRKKKVVEAYA